MVPDELAIDIYDVTKRYPVVKKGEGWLKKKKEYVTALDHVSLDVKKGEIVGILGPNGAGKTTLIKIMAGVLFQEEGAGTVNGYDTIKERQQVRKSINLLRSGGWVIFDYKISLYKNLQFWGVFHEGMRLKDAEENIERVLDIVGLGDKIHDYPENLSAGMRQKLCLAMTLLSDRPIYLMDEPTANIDPFAADYLRKFVRKELAGKGKSIVLATHNLWEAEEICDRIVILNKGKVIAFTTADELKGRVGNEAVTLELVEKSPDLLKELGALPFVDSMKEEDDGLLLYGDMKANIPELMATVTKYTVVKSTELKEPSLNDVFLQLMEELS
ncbi:MAG: ABC transporter ATP-binding protein [Thermoplasmata archaeon]|nr:ABC transporter ATP-binding protein [Thermoplasmata archaeon]